jgi:hypothetical protein
MRTAVRCVGQRLAKALDRPFAHLRVEETGSAPEITVDLWDSAESGVDEPEGNRDLVTVGVGTPLRASADGVLAFHRTHRTATCLDRRSRHIVGVVNDARKLSGFEIGRPLYVPLLLCFRDAKIQFLHSAGIGRDGRAIIMPGQSGSGKSTTSLRCLEAGLDFLGDDYIGLVPNDDGSYCASGLFSSAYADAKTLAMFPELARHAVRPQLDVEDKSVLLLAEIHPSRLKAQAEVAAVVLPRVTDRDDTRLVPVSRGRALLAAAPSSIFQMLFPERAGFERIASFIEAVDCYRLELGRDHRAPEILAELLDR